MPDRTQLADTFLAGTDWADSTRTLLAGDASNRRYDRLHRPDGSTAVLMDAPPEKGEETQPFVTIAEHLTGLGLSAPRILARDTDQGFLLIEDLGDDLFVRVLRDAPADQRDALQMWLYSAATDMLARLHVAPMPDGIAAYDAPLMADLAALAYDWYRHAGSAPDADGAQRRAAFREAMFQLLSAAAPRRRVLILRDVHAENLLWLPERRGVAKVGLLDFQDAMAGHRAYDLVSLLQDARRDVPRALEDAMIDRFCAQSGLGRTIFETAYRVHAVQRNLRILGVFARLCLRDGKVHYVDLIPRVWDNLLSNFSTPALGPIRSMLLSDLPQPTPETLAALREKCATRR